MEARPRCPACRALSSACPFAELLPAAGSDRRLLVPARVLLWVNDSEGYGICRGVVQVERLTEEGQRLAELLGPGDLLGLEGLLVPPASASASGRAMDGGRFDPLPRG